MGLLFTSSEKSVPVYQDLRHLNTLFQNHSMYKHKSEVKTVELLSTGNILTLFVVSVR